MELSAEELEDIAYKLLTCTDAEADLVYAELTDWQVNEVLRIMDTIISKMEKW